MLLIAGSRRNPGLVTFGPPRPVEPARGSGQGNDPALVSIAEHQTV